MYVYAGPPCSLWYCADTKQVSPSRPEAGAISSPPLHMHSFLTCDTEARPARGEEDGDSSYSALALSSSEMSGQSGERQTPTLSALLHLDTTEWRRAC